MHTTRGPVAGRMLRLREVAELAGTSPSAIYRWMERREFPRGMKYGTGQSAMALT